MRPCANSIFNIHEPYGINLLTRLRLGLSHLRDRKFRHCFQDTLNPSCDCGQWYWNGNTPFPPLQSFHTSGQTLLNNIRNTNEHILSHGEDQLIQTFLYGNPSFTPDDCCMYLSFGLFHFIKMSIVNVFLYE